MPELSKKEQKANQRREYHSRIAAGKKKKLNPQEKRAVRERNEANRERNNRPYTILHGGYFREDLAQ